MNQTSGTWRWLVLLAAIFFFRHALANAAEVGGFVTQSQGQITYQASGGGEQALPAFARLTSGTHVKMGDNAKLQIIYLGSGRQESWSGKTDLVAGDAESKVVGQAAAPTIKMLPPYMVETLVKSNEVMANIHARQGMVRVRSLLAASKIKEAEDRYAELRSQAAEDDIAPEIFLLTTLDGLKAYKSMNKPLEEMLRRQPDNAEAKALYDHFTLLLNTGTVEGPAAESDGK